MDKWGVWTWIGALILIFLAVVYFKGFGSDVNSTASGLSGIIKTLQGNPTSQLEQQAVQGA